MKKSIYERIKKMITNFTSNPINSLGFLIPILIGVISFISGMVAYIKFIINGGYANQVNTIKKFGLFDGYDQKFTTGTTGMITAGIVGKILAALVCVEFILLMINYFRTSGKTKRIIMLVDLVIMGIQITLTTIVFWIVIRNLFISEEAVYGVLKLFEGMPVNPKAILITYGALTTAVVICFLVLVLSAEDCRWMIGYSAIALVAAYLGIPLIFLFLQNVIPLATGAFALAVIALITLFGFNVFLSTGGEGSSANSLDSVPDLKTEKIKKVDNRPAYEKDTNPNHHYIVNFKSSGGINLYRVHSSSGDYIELDNHVVTRRLCSLQEAASGKHKFYSLQIKSQAEICEL